MLADGAWGEAVTMLGIQPEHDVRARDLPGKLAGVSLECCPGRSVSAPGVRGGARVEPEVIGLSPMGGFSSGSWLG